MSRMSDARASRIAAGPASGVSRSSLLSRFEVLARGRWGWLPVLSVVGALGLLSLALANNLSGSGVQGAEPFFWLGLLVIVAPISLRLLTPRVGRSERLGLVIVFGLYLYLVKVMQSPFAFTYSDEFVHLYNTERIFASGRLFTPNPILAESALYPGLESVTAALMRLAGLDAYSAGLVIIGLARLVMTLALFLFYEQLSGSARVASLATLLYAGSANYVFWIADYSYESLALPLVLLALYVIARRESGKYPAERQGLTLTALMLIGAVVVTHHLSSYFLTAVLVVWAILASPLKVTLLEWWRRRMGQLAVSGWGRRLADWALRVTGRPAGAAHGLGAATGGPSGLALFALVAALFWLTYVASLTLTYLSPVFGKALVALLQRISGEDTGRQLFQSNSGYLAPAWERVVGIGSVLLCLVGLPFGLRQVWRRYLYHPAVLLLAALGVTYFGLLGLRLFPAAWEISNRSSEFLFIGLALVLAMGRWPSWPRMGKLLRPGLAAAVTIIFAGGLVAGWQPNLRLAQVYQVTVGNQRLEPAGLAAARWTLAELGPGRRIATDESNGRYLLAYGEQNVFAGRDHSIKSLLESATMQDWQLRTLQDAGIEYLAVDRRLISADNMAGYFFDRGSSWPLLRSEMLPPGNYTKFEQVRSVSRILDSGDLVIYDIRAWINGAP